MNSGAGDTIQCFEAIEGLCNLESGTYEAIVAHCVTDGDIIVTWKSGNTTTFEMVAGDDLCGRWETVEVDSGKFHLSNM